MILVVSIALAWWLLLFGLALFTANPVILNREQIRRADFLVTGTVADLAAGKVLVRKEWKHGVELKTIIVENLHSAGATTDGTYLIPLTNISSEPGADTARRGVATGGGERFRITAAPVPLGQPLLYPQTPEATHELTEILRDIDRRSIAPGRG